MRRSLAYLKHRYGSGKARTVGMAMEKERYQKNPLREKVTLPKGIKAASREIGMPLVMEAPVLQAIKMR